MDSEKKRIRRKKFFIIALCAVIGAATLLGFSYSKYVSRSIDATVEYEPALFNTALLGQLVDSDIAKLTKVNNTTAYTMKVYTCSKCGSVYTSGSSATAHDCQVCGAEDSLSYVTYNQTQNGEKLTSSIVLNENVEFGVDTGSNVMKVAPGADEENYAYIYFTVTNGTTVSDVEKTVTEVETDDGGNIISQTTETIKTPQVKNVAESDISYKLHIKTTNNLPLNYELEDISTGATYTLEDTLLTTNTYTDDDNRPYTIVERQANSDYVVTDPATAGATSDFINGTRLLKWNGDEITVHRYRLKITWPSQTVVTKNYTDGKTPATETTIVYNNDLSYMKELENIEVYLEVESYVDYLDRDENSDTTSEGVMILDADPVDDGYYFLKTPSNTTPVVYNSENFYSKKVVRFDAFESVASGKLPTGIISKGADYSYVLNLYNADTVAATWVADSEDESVKIYEDPLHGKSEIRAENGHADEEIDTTDPNNDPIDGHYEYASGSGIYAGGSAPYKIVVAVPSGDDRVNASGIDWGDVVSTTNPVHTAEYAYYIVYDDVLYTGVLSDDVVTSIVQIYDEDNTTDKYPEVEQVLYRCLRFYDSDNKELSIKFSETEFQSEQLTLYRSSVSPYTECKDDFRVYIVK